MQALKAEYDSGSIDSLYFFRNSSGIEVDILQKKPEGMHLFEVKSSMSLNKDFLKGISFYAKKYGAVSGDVIYAGEDCPEYLGSRFIDFHDSYRCFEPKTEKFRLYL